MAPIAVPPVEKPEGNDGRRKQQLVFAVIWIIKCCLLYVFCAELLGIYTQHKYDCINFDMDGWFNVRVYFLIASCLLALGIILDFIMVVTSMFSPRAAIVLLCVSFLLHSVIILPQHATGMAMAFKMKTPVPSDSCTLIFKTHNGTDTIKDEGKVMLSPNGTYKLDIKYPERMLYRVLTTFSSMIVGIELVYFIVSVVFYMFLVNQL